MAVARSHPVRTTQARSRVRLLPLADRPGAIAEARTLTADFLADVPDPMVVADAVLLVSELVGNALRHAGSPGDLLLARADGLLRMEITDSSPRPPRPRPPQERDETGGLGLYLLARLAVRWGWYPLGPGKAVWCELRLPGRTR
ncbi:ATP-binding protein [Streptomyces sp. SP17BM10]|uniref:ATP-binding protein n=1 Tax=Streptomyces sp. SP17BM10 TaxID=3002530 RepID=UPI002E7A07F5|nr:ATP-binding protein [Streptomyces sp. SP17BM10]MEE1783509.1 ATP-binding protein [Streptomyces sp. SP17BM10]